MTLTILICVHSTNEFHDILLNKSFPIKKKMVYLADKELT